MPCSLRYSGSESRRFRVGTHQGLLLDGPVERLQRQEESVVGSLLFGVGAQLFDGPGELSFGLCRLAFSGIRPRAIQESHQLAAQEIRLIDGRLDLCHRRLAAGFVQVGQVQLLRQQARLPPHSKGEAGRSGQLLKLSQDCGVIHQTHFEDFKEIVLSDASGCLDDRSFALDDPAKGHEMHDAQLHIGLPWFVHCSQNSFSLSIRELFHTT